jgi:ABC-type amino acid transport system permease subunit
MACPVLGGIGVTMTVVVGALAMGLALGLFLGVPYGYSLAWLRRTVGVYFWFFRGISLLVLLSLIIGELVPKQIALQHVERI